MQNVEMALLELNGRVLSLTVDGACSKVALPAGERGPPGRDGMSIRGDKGEKGEKGDAGRDGRDSVVPGPAGERGEIGPRADPAQIRIGKVLVGEEPHVSISRQGMGLNAVDVLEFVIPRGTKGDPGVRGKDGKDGSHEYIQSLSLGNSPAWSDEYLGKYCIADGIVALPEEFPSELHGTWVHFKTFDRLVMNNAMEGQFAIEKGESCKMVVIPYAGKLVMTRF
jgi:hypothetical protein